MPDFQSSPRPRELLGVSTDFASSPVAALRQAMAADRLTATALARQCLDRITDVNPALRAVIAVSPDAMEQATGHRPALPPRMADLFDREERFTVLPNDLGAVEAAVRGLVGRNISD